MFEPRSRKVQKSLGLIGCLGCFQSGHRVGVPVMVTANLAVRPAQISHALIEIGCGLLPRPLRVPNCHARRKFLARRRDTSCDSKLNGLGRTPAEYLALPVEDELTGFILPPRDGPGHRVDACA